MGDNIISNNIMGDGDGDNDDEGIYLLHTRELYTLNLNIYKIGRSHTLDNRMKQYPNGSKIIFSMKCSNSKMCEAKLIKLFKEKFIQKLFYGNEYFEGNKNAMKREIFKFFDEILKEEERMEEEMRKMNEEKEKRKEKRKMKEEKEKKKAMVEAELKRKEKEEERKKKKEKENINETKCVKDRTCPKCNYLFKFPNLLKKHFRNSYHCLLNENEIKEYFNPTIIISINKCDKCLKNFKQKSSLYRHQRNIKCEKSQESQEL